MGARTAAGLVAIGLGVSAPLAALAQPVQRTTLQEQPFPGPVDHTVLMRTEIGSGGEVAPHTHPGVEMAYVASGAALLEIAGQPARRLGPGDSFSVPMGTVHSVRNAGPGALTLISTYVVDRTKPLATPAGGDRR
jgi:quercetin dioxygenase-like cupin family protein